MLLFFCYQEEIDGVKEAVSGKGVGYGGDEF